MASLQRIKLVLACIMALLVVAAAYVSALVRERQGALAEVSRYNVVWPTSQATTEFARLEQRLSAFASSDPTVDLDELQLRFDILVNSTRSCRAAMSRTFIGPRGSAAPVITGNFRELIERARPLIAGVAEPGAAKRLVSLMTPMDQQLGRLAAAANTWDSDGVTNDNQQLVTCALAIYRAPRRPHRLRGAPDRRAYLAESMAAGRPRKAYIAALTTYRYEGSADSPAAQEAIGTCIDRFTADTARAVADADDFGMELEALEKEWRRKTGKVRTESSRRPTPSDASLPPHAHRDHRRRAHRQIRPTGQ